MNDMGFMIGKELGELKARVEQLQGKGCGCKGKKQSRPRRAVDQQMCATLQALHPKLVAALNSALASAAKDAGIDAQLFLRSYVLSASTPSPREICCYTCDNGDYCCGDCDDSFCSNC